jgi:hypothetical protein
VLEAEWGTEEGAPDEGQGVAVPLDSAAVPLWKDNLGSPTSIFTRLLCPQSSQLPCSGDRDSCVVTENIIV